MDFCNDTTSAITDGFLSSEPSQYDRYREHGRPGRSVQRVADELAEGVLVGDCVGEGWQ